MLLSASKKTKLQTRITGYAIAVVSVAVAVGFRMILQKLISGDETPFLLLFAAVLVSAAFGGFGPGLMATFLAACSSSLLFEDVNLRDGISAAEAVRLVLFVFEGVFISALGASLQAARRRAEESEAEARRLEQKMLDISDAERRRIGQDLHDGLGQHLTGVAFLSKALQQRLAGKSLVEAADATKIVKLVTESIGQTRALAKGLAPVGLEDGGLTAALHQLTAATSSVFGIECHCFCDDQIELTDLPIASHLYRIAQEAVNNAVRHGHAKSIDVHLETKGNRMQLTIEDNGLGLSPKADHGGMGLQIMSFRARMIGGTLSVQARADGGTAVVCTAPVPINS